MFVARASDGCSSAPLTQYKNNNIYRDLIRIWLLWRWKWWKNLYWYEKKGYTDELEKINHDGGVALNIKLKKASTKKNYAIELLHFLRLNIGIYCLTKGILCHIKIIIYQKQIHINFLKWIKKNLNQKLCIY